eukprot:4240930-Amphidinium_carterae.1
MVFAASTNSNSISRQQQVYTKPMVRTHGDGESVHWLQMDTMSRTTCSFATILRLRPTKQVSQPQAPPETSPSHRLASFKCDANRSCLPW